jgi:hypothetical protein
MRTYEKVMSKKLEKMVRRNPGIGLKDKEGSSDGTERKEVKPVFIERRLTSYERKIKSFKSSIRQFWSSDRWIDIFKARTLIPLLTIIVVLYFIMSDSEHSKDQRTKWAVSRLLGINEKNVTVKPDGLITVSAERMNALDGSIESISFDFNPDNWTASRKKGYVIMNNGTKQGRYPVTLDDKGNISVNKDDRLIAGKYTENEIIWNEPQPTGVQGRYVRGYDIVHLSNNEILIKDK